MALTRVLLDTSAYSAFRRGQPEAVQAVRRAGTLLLTPVILGELRFGFARGSRTKKNEADLVTLLDSPRVQVVAIDEETAIRYAGIRLALEGAGTPAAANDIWIAASAMQHGAALLTADTDFRVFPQILVQLLPAP